MAIHDEPMDMFLVHAANNNQVLKVMIYHDNAWNTYVLRNRDEVDDCLLEAHKRGEDAYEVITGLEDH